MNTCRRFSALALILCLGTIITPPPALADDIDIFLGTSGGSGAAPNIIFLIDNSPNWSRAAQQWPDNGGIQGAAELTALSSILNSITSSQAANVGLALLDSYGGASGNGANPGNGGGYMRFGVRDMTVAANKVALQNILAGISATINSPTEKLTGMPSKEESAGFYEIYKYLSGLAPFSGPYGPGYSAQNINVDVSGNPLPLTGNGQGLNSGFALVNGMYKSPLSSTISCARTYIIYVANNANNSGSVGSLSYEPAVADARPALPNPVLSGIVGLDSATDEWTKFLYTSGVVVPAGNNNGSVVTYVLDAYNAQQNQPYSVSLINAAKVGGGKYYHVGTQKAITAALANILDEIQSVNSSFASAALPVNATNRTQNLNQVYMPLFRPDPNANPLWPGNLKQYQVVNFLGNVELGDSESPAIPAINPLTGFITSCAQSFWTTDSGSYWQNVLNPPPAKGTCPGIVPGTVLGRWSDAPDGPLVEKGGVAEVIRKGNNPPATNTTPTWAVNRTIYTLNGSGNSLTAFSSAPTGLPAPVVNFIVGHDVNDENANGDVTESRPSLHGDVIHSRPLAVDYGGSTGVTIYYGSNDGTLRAVDTGHDLASDRIAGAERWAFIAPEFYATATGFTRLLQNSPLVKFPSQPAGLVPTPTPKDYYFDGSIGLFHSLNSSKVWIYPTMRRGGRMIYAMDVTNPASPSFMWRFGCNSTGCTPGSDDIGQTWSMPVAAISILGYDKPVLVVGGGYDTCEDANTVNPSCSSPHGAGVYVLDAQSGAILKFFSTDRSVAADVALIAYTTVGVVDHGYAVDTGGNIYRLDFTANLANWAITRVAATNGAGRKFLFSPALLAAPDGHVYVAVGSGDREHPLQSQYPYSGVVNRFYVYKDNLTSTSTTNLDDTSVMKDFTSTTSCSTPGVFPASSEMGWFMKLNQNGQGEQTVTSAVIAAGLVFFSTNRPVPQALGTCSTLLGIANGYAVNLFNASGGIGVSGAACGGTRNSVFVGGGLLASPVLATVPVGDPNGNNVKNEAILIGAAQVSGGASSSIGIQRVKPAIIPARKTIFWKSSGVN